MFIRCVLNSFFSTGKIHIECQTWTEQRPKSPPVVSLISGQTSTLCIWLWQSSPAVWKYPRCSINSLDALFNFGSFFKLLCDWLESVQCCLLRIHLMALSFCWSLIQPLATSRQLCGCLLQHLYQVDPPQTFRTSFHSSRHLTRCGGVSKKVRVQALIYKCAYSYTERKKREIFSQTYLILFNKVINQCCILKMHILN